VETSGIACEEDCGWLVRRGEAESGGRLEGYLVEVYNSLSSLLRFNPCVRPCLSL
jgi:hypothetical protein